MNIAELWYAETEEPWLEALDHYWRVLRPSQVRLEQEMNSLNRECVRRLGLEEWYEFLFHKYFPWKYTAPNRLATTRKSLTRYREAGSLAELHGIHHDLFSFDTSHIRRGLEIACRIHGLGPAGASGLLALLFPETFATVDPFVVGALAHLEALSDRELVVVMKPEGLTIVDAEVLIGILQRKSTENNVRFGTCDWTPRKIDMALWAFGR
ncbi:MAG: hypothetical protein ACRD3V_07555 [Vicinamibacteria bacterium]